MRRNGFVSAVAVVVALSSVTMAQSQPKPIDYESLCKLDKSGPRRVAWMSTTPASKAETVKIQVERWRDANRSRLNSRQLANLDEVLASITPATYSEGKEAELARNKAQRVTRVTAELFTPDEMRGMSVVDGTCIATTK
jgi:hypothetical protein